MSGLALDANGYVAVDSHHRSASYTSVFAAGDVCARNDTLIQRSGVRAVRADPVLADNLIVALSEKALWAYSPKPRSLYCWPADLGTQSPLRDVGLLRDNELGFGFGFGFGFGIGRTGLIEGSWRAFRQRQPRSQCNY
jgi:hypothetical protein